MAKKFKVDLNPNLSKDFQRAIDLYEKITGDHKVGKRFVRTAKKQINALDKSALHYQIRYGNVRCLIIENFPYMAYYKVNEENNSVYVAAVIHMSESPENWPK